MIYEVAKRAMLFIADAQTGAFKSLGISHKDFEKVTSSTPWLGTDRNRVRAVLDMLIFSSVDLLGYNRFQVPVEYIAACIAVFVHPVNVMPACIIMSGAPTADHLSGSNSAEEVTPDQCFSLVMQLHTSESATSARAMFEKRVGLAIERAESSTQQKPE